MPAPTVATYSVDALVDAHQALLDLIDAGVSNGTIKIRDDADVLLAEIPLTDPAGTINTTTGQLTITASGPDPSADAGGTAAYGEVCDSDDTVVVSLPCKVGAAANSGYLVLNTLTIVASASVSIVSATVG